MSGFEQLLRDADARPLVGWDLSCDGRIGTTATPWNFEAAVVRHARQPPDMLDMGTGGGEWLNALAHRPARTVATHPCRRRSLRHAASGVGLQRRLLRAAGFAHVRAAAMAIGHGSCPLAMRQKLFWLDAVKPAAG
jgi:hypothetical protein